MISSKLAHLALPYILKALHQNPEDISLLQLAAQAELSQGRHNYAIGFLYQLLRFQPDNREVREQIRSIHLRIVGSWHFAMMNDLPRNEAFEKAISSAVRKDSLVFEIGCGSGLLAMMAARAGAKQVVTCERAVPMATVANRIIATNGFSDKIKVLRKNSKEITVGKDLPRKADLLIAEILGPAILEEGALEFIKDARERLLSKEARIIPHRADLYAFLIESEEVFQGARVNQVSGFDLSAFNALYDEPLIEYVLSRMDYRALSKDTFITSVVFSEDHKPLENHEVSFEVSSSGNCYGVAQWFRLFTDEKHSMDTSPNLKNSHWRQVVQVFDRPQKLEAGSKFIFSVTQRKNRFSFNPLRISPKQSS